MEVLNVNLTVFTVHDVERHSINLAFASVDKFVLHILHLTDFPHSLALFWRQLLGQLSLESFFVHRIKARIGLISFDSSGCLLVDYGSFCSLLYFLDFRKLSVASRV